MKSGQYNFLFCSDVAKVIDSIEDIGLVERWGLYLESKLQGFFQTWGTFCASYPVAVLICGE